MTSELFDRFVPVICAGLGLVLVGGANLLLVRCGRWVRVAVTGAVLGLVAGAVAALGQSGLLASTAQLLALVLLPCLLFAFRAVPERLGAAVAALHQPRVLFGLLTGVGVTVSLGACVMFERADNDAQEAATADLDLMHAQPPSAPTDAFRATTDRGTQIVLREASAEPDGVDRRLFEDRMLRSAPR